MKSQPDAASRVAAEVVTQLPVPSRLGMLRFERLNEATWAMLYLDPACERQFGVPASELCALIDAPYASLMEPEARYRLHDEIQLQLNQRNYYRVRYTFHAQSRTLRVLEVGEAFKQHNRQLLRGFLTVLDDEDEAAFEANDLESRNNRLELALQLNQRAQQEQFEHLERVRGQQDLILRLARQRYSAENSLLELRS